MDIKDLTPDLIDAPWSLEERGTWTTVRDASHRPVAEIWLTSSVKAEQRIKAALVTAAPDLLEALEAMLSECDAVGSPAIGTADKARAAIARARGEG